MFRGIPAFPVGGGLCLFCHTPAHAFLFRSPQSLFRIRPFLGGLGILQYGGLVFTRNRGVLSISARHRDSCLSGRHSSRETQIDPPGCFRRLDGFFRFSHTGWRLHLSTDHDRFHVWPL